MRVALSACAVMAAPGQTTAGGSRGVVEVVDTAGRPIAGVEITHSGSDPRHLVSRGGMLEGVLRSDVLTTDAEGRVYAEDFLEPGFLELHAPARLGGKCAANKVVPYRGWRASQPVTRVTLAIKPLRRHRLRGRVLGPDGRPIAGASIDVLQIHPVGSECDDSGPERWFKSGTDGRFALPPLPRGDIELRVVADGYAEKRFSEPLPAGPRDLALERGVRWTGQVLDPDGVPIERCGIELQTRDDIRLTGNCGGAAGFDIPHIPPGKLKLRIEVGDDPTLGRRALLGEVDVAPGERKQEDLRFPAGLTLAGRVVTATGEPVASETVGAIPIDQAHSPWAGELQVKTDADGRFAFRHLAAGQWRIGAGLRGPKPDMKTVGAGAAEVKLVIGVRH